MMDVKTHLYMFHQKYTLSIDLFVFLKTLNAEIIFNVIFHKPKKFLHEVYWRYAGICATHS